LRPHGSITHGPAPGGQFAPDDDPGKSAGFEIGRRLPGRPCGGRISGGFRANDTLSWQLPARAGASPAAARRAGVRHGRFGFPPHGPRHDSFLP
jgi:hypothetical protein